MSDVIAGPSTASSTTASIHLTISSTSPGPGPSTAALVLVQHTEESALSQNSQSHSSPQINVVSNKLGLDKKGQYNFYNCKVKL